MKVVFSGCASTNQHFLRDFREIKESRLVELRTYSKFMWQFFSRKKPVQHYDVILTVPRLECLKWSFKQTTSLKVSSQRPGSITNLHADSICESLYRNRTSCSGIQGLSVWPWAHGNDPWAAWCGRLQRTPRVILWHIGRFHGWYRRPAVPNDNLGQCPMSI